MNKKRKIITCLVLLAALMLFFVGLFSAAAFYLTAKIIDEKPMISPIEKEIPPPESISRATAKAQELFMAIMNPSPEREKTLTLSGNEINALISMAENFQGVSSELQSEGGDPMKKVFVNFKDGKFTIAFSKKMDFSTPFGSYLNVCIVIIPELSAQSKDIKIESLKVGNINVPPPALRGKLGQYLNFLCGVNGNFTKTVKSISIDKSGNLVVIYDPARLKLLIQDKITEKMSGSQQPK